MKKIISILMVSIMVLALFTFAGCNKQEPTLKLGLGVYVTASATDATEDKAGQGQGTITAAAVLVDAEGKIVKAFIDVADNKVGYTADGKAVANDAFTTKYEAGKDYNMVAYGGAAKEWFEQADALNTFCIGKTATELKSLVANGYGIADVQTAGCTISIEELIKAAVKAAD